MVHAVDLVTVGALPSMLGTDQDATRFAIIKVISAYHVTADRTLSRMFDTHISLADGTKFEFRG